MVSEVLSDKHSEESKDEVEPHNCMHYVYILKCSDNSYYIGYTTNLEQRLKEHNEGSGGHNTLIKRPVQLVYTLQHSCHNPCIGV